MKSVYLASGVADWMYPFSKVYPKALLKHGIIVKISEKMTQIIGNKALPAEYFCIF